MSDFKYTEQSIQKSLNGFFASWKYNVDNLYVFSWESDKLLWTKAGYIYEFEIKISRADYKNDFKHKAEKHIILSSTIAKERQKVYEQDLFEKEMKRHPWWGEEDVRSHYSIERVTKGRKLPNYFYYAVPKGMIQVDEVPEYAGLIWIDEDTFYVKKKAPCLHKEKYTDAELNLSEKFYYNWKSAKQTLRQAEKTVEYYKTQLELEVNAKNQECSFGEMKKKYEAAHESAQRWMADAAANHALYMTMVEGADYNRMERRMLIDIIKGYCPNFDYQLFTEKVEKRYHECYPSR